MGTDSLRQLTDVFTRRFVLNALLPTLVFATVCASVVVSTAWTMTSASAWWGRLDLLTRLLVIVAYLAGVYFLAAATASQWRGIVRLYEGYPLSRLARRLGGTAVGVRWHLARLDELRGDESPVMDPVRAYHRYPFPDHRDDVLPTRLGNILLAGERYPLDRYRIDPIFFWPRLFPLLPESFQREYESFLINYEFPLVVSFQSVVTAVVGAGAVLAWHGSVVLFLGMFVGGLLLAYAAYCASLSSAEELAEQQRTAFDLYRDRLLDAWPTVADVRDERDAFEEIYYFVVSNAEPNWEQPQSSHAERRREAESDADSSG
jgi:hypothetical protein